MMIPFPAESEIQSGDSFGAPDNYKNCFNIRDIQNFKWLPLNTSNPVPLFNCDHPERSTSAKTKKYCININQNEAVIIEHHDPKRIVNSFKIESRKHYLTHAQEKNPLRSSSGIIRSNTR